MTLARKLALFAVAAAVLPLVGVAFSVVARSERALARRAVEEQGAAARAGAEAVARDLLRVQEDLGRALEAWNPTHLDREELEALLFLLTRQVPDASAAAAVDAAGHAQVWGARGADDPGLAPFVEHALEAHQTARWEGTAFGLFGRGEGAVAALREVRSARGERWVVAVRLEPTSIRRRLDELSQDGRAAWLLDGAGTPLVTATGAPALSPPERQALASLRRTGDGRGVVAGAAGSALAGIAPLPEIASWSVAVRLPGAIAFREVAALRRAVLGASAAVAAIALLAALLVARSLTGRLASLQVAAGALGAGDLTARVEERGADELGQVARAFNGMAGELQSARSQLEGWNEELQRQVDARTRELKEAQAPLVEAQKLAAIGQLGGGVAHEINNPLTGILGNAQLLLATLPEEAEGRDLIGKIEALARRCRDITQNLLRFSEQRLEPDFREVELNRTVTDAIDLTTEQARSAGVVLELALAEPAPRVRGDAGQLEQVVLHLLNNANAACLGRPGARVRVATRIEGEEAVVEVRDEGKGIAAEHLARIFEPFFTTKDVWTNVGLGLSVSYRIVAEHGGRIAVESRVGEGSTFAVRLPVARAQA
ncbi:MAG TPA: ATP-binding protein [Anaeromyxobacteraceae bacterium]|nr:ATP-binding protein [Anaeromyxobacteraceae bacterium]